MSKAKTSLKVPGKHVLSIMQAFDIVDGFAEASADKTLAAWQVLVSTGMTATLSGRYGRMAAQLIEEGLIYVPAR